MLFPAFDIPPGDAGTRLRVAHYQDLTTPTALPDVPHTHNYYSLTVLLQGRTTYYAEPVQLQVEAPALLLLDKDQVHVHGPHQGAEMLAISFTDWLLSRPAPADGDDWPGLFATPIVPLTAAELARLQPYLDLLQAEYARDQPHNSTALTRHLLALVLQLVREFQAARAGQAAPAAPALYQGFAQALNAHYRQATTVRAYAEQLAVTAEQLQRAVQAATGKTPKQLIDERRLLEAKRLLYWAQLPAKEIAWQLGFANAQYFSRFFKQHAGCSPLEFRALVNQQDNRMPQKDNEPAKGVA